jgi:alanyl-tRNA synthetase
MAPFKDCFLGNATPPAPRVADTQKCLRVSGKHNDLEDVGLDGTHHTLFEMLGNWSFGDYFKTEAIAWSWELLTEVYGMEKSRLYATVFEGDAKENLEEHTAAYQIWLKYLPKEQILFGNKKDNFWEMGEQGPCGPCSEIHYDTRSAAERAKGDGAALVNVDNSGVVEIWNNVFMKYNRKADGSLEPLPARHVDTGMGFERLCMVLQDKKATYDTDIFMPYIRYIEGVSGIAYTNNYEKTAKTDIAMRVCVDHIRAVAFTIADGQLPASGGAGYVIRRILRRAVRYYFSFLGIKEPFLCTLVPLLANDFKDVFPELYAQKDFVTKVIQEEERSFLRTLDSGLKRLETIDIQANMISGQQAFELFDTFGFPIDLTRLIADDKGVAVDEVGFEAALLAQKNRSKADAQKETSDWVQVREDVNVEFLGYDTLTANAQITKYRTVKTTKGKEFQVVLNRTPFYPEGGGQVGDTGVLDFGTEQINVIDTKKENDLIIHYLQKLPADPTAEVRGEVQATKRHLTENNHSATHLVHAALRTVLGTHVAQKGSLVNQDLLRFDFSHFQKVTDEEIAAIERIVNQKIRENIPLIEARNMPIAEAQAAGAMMLFGEKYGENVRMITFEKGYSQELCGGCHVAQTGNIGFFKIISEGSVAAGVRRIEAVTADGAEAFLHHELASLHQVKTALKNPKDLAKAIETLQDDHKNLQKQVEKLYALQANLAKADLVKTAETINGVNFVSGIIAVENNDAIKQMLADINQTMAPMVACVGATVGGKPQILLYITEALAAERKLNAAVLIREAAKHIQGGGGGQAHFATAGGTNANGLAAAIAAVKTAVAL